MMRARRRENQRRLHGGSSCSSSQRKKPLTAKFAKGHREGRQENQDLKTRGRVEPPQRSRSFSRFFWRQIEVHQIAAEAPRLPGSEGDAHRHPDRTSNLCWAAQVQPEKQADQESRDRWNQVGHLLLRLAHVVAHEGGRVYTHECDERAEVQHLGTQPVAEESDTYQQSG